MVDRPLFLPVPGENMGGRSLHHENMLLYFVFEVFNETSVMKTKGTFIMD